MYGSKTEISHDPDDFTPEAREWLRFIMRIVQEDQQQYERMQALSRALCASLKTAFSCFTAGGLINSGIW